MAKQPSRTITLPSGEVVPAIELKGVGLAPAKRAADLVAGDVTRSNFSVEKDRDGFLVLSVRTNYVEVTERHLGSGTERSRKLRVGTLVAYFP